jgi:hypothetical protein
MQTVMKLPEVLGMNLSGQGQKYRKKEMGDPTAVK